MNSFRFLLACLLSGLALFVAGCTNDESAETAPRAAEERTAKPAAKRATEPVDKTKQLSASDIAGELVMTKLDGATATEAELAAVRDGVIGGIILFSWNVQTQDQLKGLVDSLSSARKARADQLGIEPTILVSVDQEGGSIRNVPFAPPTETNREIGQRADADAAEQIGFDTGSALRAAGVNIDLGPVGDLTAGPNNTMAGRAFSSEPELAATLTAATVRGLQRGGVAATTKHFPGFGASSANSDDAVAYVDRTMTQLRAQELEPFRAAIEAKTEIIMVSHGIRRELGSKMPGIIDPKITTELLRDELGFEGVAMTDSMNAKGFRDAWGDTVPRACPKALGAGIDILLLTGSLETATLCRKRIIDAVRDGSLPEARLREAYDRVNVLRAKLSS